MSFLPVCMADMKKRGWSELDFIFVSGDAYVDHPSFGAALLTRLLESRGFKVGLICQPDWRKTESFAILGKPKLGFFVSGGNMDTMVMHYTAAKKPRKEDYFSPGKKMGLRPDRATLVYCAAIRQVFKKTPLIIGGIEVSLRRLAHYDYWDNKVRRSILLDSKADMAVYGMGESSILEIAEGLKAGKKISEMRTIKGTIIKTSSLEDLPVPIELPSFETISQDKKSYAQSFLIQHKNTDPFSAKALAEKSGNEWVYQNPPSFPLSQSVFDSIYELPYERAYHPQYKSEGGISALDEVQFSLISSRGCFGSCSFCALTFHQGRIIQARSQESLIREAQIIIKSPQFKGYIHDVGGPTANFRKPACAKMEKSGACQDKNCLAPSICSNLKADHSEFLDLLRKLRALPGVKKVFIRSGIRYDYLLHDSNPTFFKELVEHHISGQLKVAPEHISDSVLTRMGKPSNKVFETFKAKFKSLNDQCGKKQFLVPYFISGHPGSTLKDAIELAQYIKKNGTMPEQVQDFYPTPGTLSTAMYHSELELPGFKKIFIAKTPQDKAMQRALLQFSLPQNYDLVKKALVEAGRTDLIGLKHDCLIPPYQAGKKPIKKRK